MATPISELLVKISADSSGLQKGLTDAGKSADNFSKDITQALSGAVTAMGVMTKAIQGVQFNAMAEQAEVAFTTMLGSAKKAQDLIAQMFDFAKTTPFEFTQVRDAGKQLLAFGIEADKIIPTLKMLGDVGAGVGSPIGDLAYLFGTIQTQGRAMTQDLMQFANRGIPIWDELANVTGKSGAELKKMVEAGKIGFPQIESAFKNMSGEGGKFFNLMESQSSTFTGAMSNLNDSFDMFLGSMTKGFMGPLEGGARALTSFIGIVDQSPPVLKNTAAMVALVGTALIGAIPALKLFGIALNTSILGPVGIVTAAIGVLSLEVFNLMAQIEDNKSSEEFLKGFDVRMKNGTASARDFERALKIIADQQKILSDKKNQWYNPMSGFQNLSGDTDRLIKENDRYKNQVIKSQDNLLRNQVETSKKNLTIAQQEAAAKIALVVDFVSRQDQLLKAGLISEEEYYKNRVKAQEEAIANIMKTEELLTKAQVDDIARRQKEIDDFNAKLKIIEDEKPENLKKRLESEAEIQKAADNERYAREIAKSEESIANTEKTMAEDKAITEKNLADKKKLTEEYYAAIETFSDSTFQVLGALNDAFDLGIGDSLKNIETLGTGVQKVFSSGGTDIGGWVTSAVGAIGLLGQAWDVFSGEKARKDAEARAEEIRAFEATAEARLDSTIEGLERERAEKISQAIAIGAQTRDIEIYYARAVARARITANESVLAEKAKVEAEAGRITKYWSDKAVTDAKAFTSKVESNIRNDSSLGREQKTWALASLGSVYDNYLKYFQGIYTQSSNAALEAMEMSFALFGDRATEASKGLASAMVDGFKSGDTEAEIKDSIFTMLENMAIEAAIMASGIGDKFEVIGAQIAEALRDGFMSGSELSGIEAEVNKLYAQASQTVSSVSGIFGSRGGASAPVASGQSGSFIGGSTYVNIYSPKAVDPVSASRILTNTMQNLAIQGAV